MWATASYLEDWKVRWLLVGGGIWAGLTGNVLGRGRASGERGFGQMPTEKSHGTAGDRRGKIGVQMASDFRRKGLVCAWKAVGSQGQLLGRVWQSELIF